MSLSPGCNRCNNRVKVGQLQVTPFVGPAMGAGEREVGWRVRAEAVCLLCGVLDDSSVPVSWASTGRNLTERLILPWGRSFGLALKKRGTEVSRTGRDRERARDSLGSHA